MGEFYRFDISRHLESGARGIIGKVGIVDVPTRLDDILDLTTLDLAEGWIDAGSAREGQSSSYNRNITTTDSRIEQSNAAVRTRITEVERTITLQFAEFTKEKLALLEGGGTETTIAGAAHRSPQFRVDGGNIESLDRYRVVLLGVRGEGEGHDITDEDGDVRGELLAAVLLNAQLSADNAQWELQRGQIADMPLTFKGFNEPTIADNRVNVVSWIGENGPATIAAA